MSRGEGNLAGMRCDCLPTPATPPAISKADQESLFISVSTSERIEEWSAERDVDLGEGFAKYRQVASYCVGNR